MVGGVPNHAALADQSLADLELRLDQRHRLPVVRQHCKDRGQDLLEGDERYVERGQRR